MICTISLISVSLWGKRWSRLKEGDYSCLSSISYIERLWALELDLACQSLCLFEQDATCLGLSFPTSKNENGNNYLDITAKIEGLLEGLFPSEH